MPYCLSPVKRLSDYVNFEAPPPLETTHEGFIQLQGNPVTPLFGTLTTGTPDQRALIIIYHEEPPVGRSPVLVLRRHDSG
jgi:hypothetical protein